MRRATKHRFAVYALSDSRTGRVRYVGVTRRDVDVRVHAHVVGAHLRRDAKSRWLDDLARAKRRVVVSVLEITPPVRQTEAWEVEADWIRRLWGDGLFNMRAVGGLPVVAKPLAKPRARKPRRSSAAA